MKTKLFSFILLVPFLVKGAVYAASQEITLPPTNGIEFTSPEFRGAKTATVETVIEVISLSDVRINGQNAGQLADVIANHRHLASAVQMAALKWQADQISQLASEKAAAKAEADIAKAAADAAREDQAHAEKTRADLVAALDVINLEAASIPKETREALRAARKARDKQREEKQAKRAALEAELEKLADSK